MLRIQKIFDFYVFSNLHVSLAVFALTKLTLANYGVWNNSLPWFTFSATFLSYNFIRIYKLSHVQHWVNQFIKKNRILLLGFMLLSASVLFYLVFSLRLEAVFWLAPFAFFTLFYELPLNLNFKNPISLRNISFLKLFLIAISWAGVTVLFPLVNYEIPLTEKEWLLFGQRFLFVISITLPFDIRDMAFDKSSLRTIPQLLGVNYTKRFGILCLVLFLGIELLFGETNLSGLREHFFIALIVLFFLMRAREKQDKYYSAFWVESIPIVWLLLHYLLT